ncbi:reverse transcriptase family protein [Ralstonia solanacearum]|uniref:reverse transcriptase family protein n=1 Tax=Ralstonia solanacearum TaxID=305 RepID=UPI0013DDFBA9|nr:reverse transcriptase family protein [Ralstonia solanacearum]MCL9844599.1 reverse transcriptase family protein [Ralstonia solanacearum]MDC6253183.1 reverse transcriptase family protein [Ralstonia solanacearum]MDC6258792.1 reverse transcriptase family protein [Ralstonia solanacearum]MDC6301579.1 reverse transcriptase family protein [Ralstonia solanacearum]
MCITLICEDRTIEGRLTNGGRSFESPAVRQAAATKATSFALPVDTPLPLLFFESIDELVGALSPLTRERYEPEIRRLFDARLPPAASIHVVATLFGYSPSFVVALLKRPERYYRTFYIKSGKKVRLINAPKVSIKIIQRWIGGNIARNVQWLPCVFGFVPGKSSVDAARVHCEADWVYSVDIKDFFPSTRSESVQVALIKLGYKPHAAELIARLCCHGGRLAQGAPSSPTLSNLVFQPFDEQLQRLADTLNVKYTRYADDMVFSGENAFPEKLKNGVSEIFLKSDWVFAQEKEYFAKRPTRLKVHGLLVDGRVPRLTRGYQNKIRAYRHMLEAGKVAKTDIERIRGHVAYADLIEKKTNLTK